MRRRQQRVSLILLLCFIQSTAFATEPVTEFSSRERPVDLDEPLRLSLDLNVPRYEPTTKDFIDSITMFDPPPGSLRYRFEGLHGFVMKHVRSQYRRFVRRAVKEGWHVIRDQDSSERELYRHIDDNRGDPFMNGVWWTRSWLYSLPPEKGGAPAKPYVHTYGEENAVKLGPFTITNTFKIKFDYIAFFELNPDPVSHEHGRRQSPVSFDVKSVHNASFGTQVRFRLRPQIRIGVPEGNDMLSFLRGAALRGSFDISHRGKKILGGEIEVKWRAKDGVIVALEVALLSW
jgi:hypothetical protein